MFRNSHLHLHPYLLLSFLFYLLLYACFGFRSRVENQGVEGEGGGGHSHETEQEQEHEGELGALRDLEVEEDAQGQGQDQQVGQDVEGGRGREEDPPVDAGPGHGEVPHLGDGRALEDNHEEDRHHVREVRRVQPQDVLAHAALLPEQPEQEQQDRRLDQREDRVVQELHRVVPHQTYSEVVRGDLFKWDPDVVGFDDFLDGWLVSKFAFLDFVSVPRAARLLGNACKLTHIAEICFYNR